MGMGMLFAGALTGAGNALGSMADDAIKREDEQRKYQMAVQERRDALLYEMEMKEKFARRVEQADAQSYERAVGAAQQAGDDRRFAKFSTDMAQSGYGEGMDDAQKRAIFEQHYNDKVVSDEAGGARYYEPESADKADILAEMRRGGASGAAIKTAREDYTAQLKAEQSSAEAVRKERSERAREDLRSRQLDQQWAISEANRGAAEERLRMSLEGRSRNGNNIDQTEKLSVLKDVNAKAAASMPSLKDFRGNAKNHEAAIAKWKETTDGKLYEETSRKMLSILGQGGSTANPAQASESKAPASAAMPSSMPRPKTPEEAAKLPPGTPFLTPDGRVKIR